MKTQQNVVLVTDAPRSRDEEFRARKKRYLLTMAARVVLLILAALLATTNIWAAAAAGLTSAIMPWIAVVMANDRPPKNSKKFRAAAPSKPERQIESASAAAARARIIEAEPSAPPAAKENYEHRDARSGQRES